MDTHEGSTDIHSFCTGSKPLSMPLPQATASQLLAGASGATADAQAQAEQLLSSIQASTSELTGAASDAAASAVRELAAALCLSSTTRHRLISLINLHDYMERMLLGFWSIPLPNSSCGVPPARRAAAVSAAGAGGGQGLCGAAGVAGGRQPRHRQLPGGSAAGRAEPAVARLPLWRLQGRAGTHRSL